MKKINEKGLGILEMLIILAVLFGIGIAGYYIFRNHSGTSPNTRTISHSGPVRDYVSLVDALRAKSAMVVPGSTTEAVTYSVKGQMLKINGEDMLVYEFDTAEAAKNAYYDKNKIIDWVPETRIYLKERLIVTYAGGHQSINNLLTSVLGKPVFGDG